MQSASEAELKEAKIVYRQTKKHLQNALKRAEMYRDFDKAENLYRQVQQMRDAGPQKSNHAPQVSDEDLRKFLRKHKKAVHERAEKSLKEEQMALSMRLRKRAAYEIREAELAGLEEDLQQRIHQHDYKSCLLYTSPSPRDS